MSIQFKLMLLGWVLLGIVVIALAIYRKMLARREDVYLHVLDSEVAAVGQQSTIASKIEAIEKWGKALTAVELLYGLALAAIYIYAVWTVSQKTFWTD